MLPPCSLALWRCGGGGTIFTLGSKSLPGSAGRSRSERSQGAAHEELELLPALSCELRDDKQQQARAGSSPSCLRKPLGGKSIKKTQNDNKKT